MLFGSLDDLFTLTFRLCRHTEGLLDLRQVQHHGQLVNLPAVGQIPGRHDGWDAQLLLQDAQCQLVVVNGAGLLQGGHVSAEESERSGDFTELLVGEHFWLAGVTHMS